MPTSSKIPLRYLDLTVSDLAVGDEALASLDCLRIDFSGAGWINPLSEPVAIGPQEVARYGSHIGLILKRSDRGFSVDLKRASPPTHYVRGPKPESIHGMDWFSVVEFITPDEPGPIADDWPSR